MKYLQKKMSLVYNVERFWKNLYTNFIFQLESFFSKETSEICDQEKFDVFLYWLKNEYDTFKNLIPNKILSEYKAEKKDYNLDIKRDVLIGFPNKTKLFFLHPDLKNFDIKSFLVDRKFKDFYFSCKNSDRKSIIPTNIHKNIFSEYFLEDEQRKGLKNCMIYDYCKLDKLTPFNKNQRYLSIG